jgi:hypothetical protein
MKKLWLLLLTLLLVTGCSSSSKEEEVNESIKYEKFTIKTEITNEAEKDNKYLVYLMPVGVLNTDPGYANQSGYYGPLETDANGEVEIDLSYNRDIAWYLNSDENDKPGYLEVYITTVEDIYIRNPLNKKQEIKFIKDNSGEPYPEYEYYSSVEEVTVPFTDKYPDKVLSLTFQDATFVIKFEFEDGFEPTNSYVAGLNWTGTMYNTSRINRKFQYWDLPFFQSDKLENRVGTIQVKHFDTNEPIAYEGEPKTLTFDADGKCEQGNIITIKILRHD